MPSSPLSSVSPTSGAVLTIDLNALRANYRALSNLAAGTECAAVVKANAYGTGSMQTVRALAREGCKTFFVASFKEAEIVRGVAPDATIYVLDGLFDDSGPAFAAASIRPVLSSLDEVRHWSDFCRQAGMPLPAAIHVDTGLNRLGMPRIEAEELKGSPDLVKGFKLALLISHLVCADEPERPNNEAQLQAFEDYRAMLPACPASLANSGGIHLGERYHFDLVRAGFSLYGGKAVAGRDPLSPVVQLHARIVQIRDARHGETVGYGAAHMLERPTRIATLALGYADGIFRCLGATHTTPGLTGYIDGHPAPALGRISMDLITLDVTDVPVELARRGAWVEIIGEHVSVDELAEQAGTIGYEVLTSLGTRAERVYLDSQSGNG